MVYQRVSKFSPENFQIHKKDVASTIPQIPVQASSDSDSPQDEEMPSYTPLAADWMTTNNLMKNLSGIEPIQAKLTIGEVGDKYEQEADKVAQQVVSQIHTPASVQSSPGQSLQREEISEEEELQMKSESAILQREEIPEDEELQMKSESAILQREEISEEEELQIQKQDSPSTAPAIPIPTKSIQGTVIQRKYNVIGMLMDGGLQKDMNSGVKVPYMNEQERVQYEITVNNGLLLQNGNPLDTTHVSNQIYIFVMDENGRIFSADKNEVEHHSSFMSGRPVAAAGTIKVVQGQLQSIDNQSGHYQPTKDYMDQFIKELKKRNVDLKNVEKSLGQTKKKIKKAYKKRGWEPRTRLYTPELPQNKYY